MAGSSMGMSPRGWLIARRAFIVVLHGGLVWLANSWAFWLRFDGVTPAWAVAAQQTMLPWLLGIRLITFAPLRLYQGLWRYTGIWDLRNIVTGVGISSLIFVAVTRYGIGLLAYPRSVYIIDALLLLCLMGGIRITRRFYTNIIDRRPRRRVLVYGAGDAGEMIVRDIRGRFRRTHRAVGFIDDDPVKVGQRIHGVPVLGTRQDLTTIMERWAPDEVLIAIPTADSAMKREVLRLLQPFDVSIKTLPAIRELVSDTVDLTQIRSLSVEDLLMRAPVGLDQAPIRRLINGRRVMVTGAGGSIGSELCRQVMALHPESLILFERHENSLYAVHLELAESSEAGPTQKHAAVGDVTDRGRVEEVMRRHRPEIVFHAAAHKHVPLMESNPCEAIKNNVRGTRVVAQVAEDAGVQRFVFISTDKAVHPASVMGMSKYLAEQVVRSESSRTKATAFSIVRFGNVLDSSGSVVPRFKEQIAQGGPVTVTHPDVRRFFMLIPEAVQLVLHAAAQADRGVTYVLEMGEQVRVADLARDLIRLSGHSEDDIRIEFTGLRPGEKLSEELAGRYEAVLPSKVAGVFRISSTMEAPDDFPARVEHLEELAIAERTDEVLEIIRELSVATAPEAVEEARG